MFFDLVFGIRISRRPGLESNRRQTEAAEILEVEGCDSVSSLLIISGKEFFAKFGFSPGTELLRGSLQRAVQGPEKRFMEASRGKQMDVDETESDSHEPMDIEEAQNFFWIGSGGLRQ